MSVDEYCPKIRKVSSIYIENLHPGPKANRSSPSFTGHLVLSSTIAYANIQYHLAGTANKDLTTKSLSLMAIVFSALLSISVVCMKLVGSVNKVVDPAGLA